MKRIMLLGLLACLITTTDSNASENCNLDKDAKWIFVSEVPGAERSPDKSLAFFVAQSNNKESFLPPILPDGISCYVKNEDASYQQMGFKDELATVFAYMKLSKLEMSPENPDRELWDSGVKINVVYFSDSPCTEQSVKPFVTFEKPQINPSVLSYQFKQIVSLISNGGGITKSSPKLTSSQEVTKEEKSCAYIQSQAVSYTQNNKLDFSALQKIEVSRPNEISNGKEKIQTTGAFLLGPKQSMFLSMDVLPTSVSQLKYDQTNKVVTTQSAPSHTFMSLNYQLGDILTDYPSWDSSRIILKLIVAANSKPLDSLGLGVGYVLKQNILGTGKDLPFAAFVGVFRTNPDSPGLGTKTSIRFGISYNFGTPTPVESVTNKSKSPL